MIQYQPVDVLANDLLTHGRVAGDWGRSTGAHRRFARSELRPETTGAQAGRGPSLTGVLLIALLVVANLRRVRIGVRAEVPQHDERFLL